MQENKLKENDVVNLTFANYCYKHNKTPTIFHNITPTLTTSCEVVVIEKEKGYEK